MRKPQFLSLPILAFALLAIWCWAIGIADTSRQVGYFLPPALGIHLGGFSPGDLGVMPFNPQRMGLALLLPGALFLLPAAILLLVFPKISGHPGRGNGGAILPRIPAAACLLLCFLLLGFAFWAYANRPSLWSRQLFVQAPGIVALLLCGVFYGVSFFVLRKSRPLAQSALYLLFTGVCLIPIVGFGVLKPALSPSKRVAALTPEQNPSRAVPSSPSPITEEPLRFLVFGDTGHRPDHLRATQKRADELTTSKSLTGILLLGDNLSGKPLPFDKVMEDRFIKPFKHLRRRNPPFFAILGNHDTNVKDWAIGEMQSPLLGMGGRNYYSKTFGNGLATIFFLCSEGFWANPDQIAWFVRELAVCRSTWRVVCFHQPLWGGEEGESADSAICNLMERMMTAPKGQAAPARRSVDLVLSGHNHVYERRAITNGILFLTVGNSSNSSDLPEHLSPEMEVIYSERRAFGYLELDPREARFQAVNDKGLVVDKTTLGRAQ